LWKGSEKKVNTWGSSPCRRRDLQRVRPLSTDASRSSERIQAVFARSDGNDPLSLDHTAYASLLKLTADDFLAAAAGLPKLLEGLKDGGESKVLAEAWMDRWIAVDRDGALLYLSHATLLSELAKANSSLRWQLSHAGGVFT
jgi:hypothetical protein